MQKKKFIEKVLNVLGQQKWLHLVKDLKDTYLLSIISWKSKHFEFLTQSSNVLNRLTFFLFSGLTFKYSIF